MKRQTLVNGLLSLTAVSLMTGCVDDKYDLSDIDTTSRFTVNDLTVPVNLQQIKLENVVNLDDNENIETINGEYAISKGGSIAPKEFKLDPISVNAPDIDQIKISVNAPAIALPGIALPPLDLLHVDLKEYDFTMNHVDKALQVLEQIKTTPISIKVTLSVPSELSSGSNSLTFKNLNIKLPWGLIVENSEYKYNDETGLLEVGDKEAKDGKVELEVVATGLNLLEKGIVKEEDGNRYLGINGKVGIEDGCKIQLTINESVTMPSPIIITADFDITGFSIKSFSGQINYKMDDINIAPISLSDLPDFLDDPATNLIIANPEISVAIQNPVAQYGLVGEGKLTLTSDFGEKGVKMRSSQEFKIKQNGEDGWCYLTLTPAETNEDTGNYQFADLGYVLTNHNPDETQEEQEAPGWGLPKSISVSIGNLVFEGKVEDLPLADLGYASGDYSFTAPLGFGKGSKVIYETTESGWGSDDLDKVNINKINLLGLCTTNLPVSVQLKVFPIDKYGNKIEVKENSGLFHVPANASNEPVALLIEGKNGRPIKDFDGVQFIATVEQNGDNTGAIGPDLFIELKDLNVTVDGYYETDF